MRREREGGEEGTRDRGPHYPHLIPQYHVLYWGGKAGSGKEGGRERYIGREGEGR